MAKEVRHFTIFLVGLCCISASFSAVIRESTTPLDPDHVPTSVCVSMIPGHDKIEPSKEPVPYTIKLSTETASPGETIQVTVSGNNGRTFRGIYMQARILGSGADAVGQFSPNNLLSNPAIRISSCPPGSENAISYISREAIPSLVIDWKVPEGITGQIYFRSTFVETFSMFWTNVDSLPLTINDSA